MARGGSTDSSLDVKCGEDKNIGWRAAAAAAAAAAASARCCSEQGQDNRTWE